MKKQQQGGTVIGFIVGLVVGLGVALAVAVYVTKVPVPFLDKGASRGGEQDAAEAQKNKNWNPNSPLQGSGAVRPNAPAAAGVVGSPPPAEAPTVGAAPAPAAPAAAVPATPPREAAAKPAPSADPLGDLAKARSAAAAPAPAPASVDPFDYFVQAGAFRTQSDADAQRAKLAMLGWEARVSEREQNGRTVFRVRVGPFGKRSEAEQIKEKLDGAAIESALVRVQR